MTDDVSIRRGSAADFPAVLELARRALGWTDVDARFLEWKHRDNPLGESPMWLAEAGGRVVGFRTLLRWDLVEPSGRIVHAVRAVDTATDPDFQGRGIFTKLTLGALDPLRDEGIELVFNTPNDKSRPGYLKMGWHEVGRLPVEVRPSAWRFPVAVVGARESAGRAAVSTEVGDPAPDVLGDVTAVSRLLGAIPRADGLATHRTPSHLAWRYGNGELAYRAAVAGSIERGLAIFRLRQRGSAVEAVVAEVIVRGNDGAATRELLRTIASARADYLIRLGSAGRIAAPREAFIRLPRVGPVLACRPLLDAQAPKLSQWSLTMGDVELL